MIKLEKIKKLFGKTRYKLTIRDTIITPTKESTCPCGFIDTVNFPGLELDISKNKFYTSPLNYEQLEDANKVIQMIQTSFYINRGSVSLEAVEEAYKYLDKYDLHITMKDKDGTK